MGKKEIYGKNYRWYVETDDSYTNKVVASRLADKNEMIVGGRVNTGQIKKNSRIAVFRGEIELGRAEILELQQTKVAAKTISANEEFGIKLKTPVKILEGDILESFEEKIKIKTL